jgi:Amt family ammonium transporter
MLAGLVAITAPCAFVNSVSACIIGLISGVLVVEACFFIERVLKVDDPVGAIAVHGVNGAWGVLSIGIFADGTYGEGWNGVPGKVTGLIYGNSSQIVAQMIGVAANIVYIGAASFIIYKLIDAVIGNRVSAAAEVEGLDLPEMGIPGYVGVAEDAEAEHARTAVVGKPLPAPGR